MTELSTDLGIHLPQSSLLLGSFIGVLWILSGNVVFHLSGRSFAIPGYMVWCALVYTGTASWISWLIGRPLAQLYAAHYAQEAELRFALVRLNEHIDSVLLYGGEEGEKQHLITELIGAPHEAPLGARPEGGPCALRPAAERRRKCARRSSSSRPASP